MFKITVNFEGRADGGLRAWSEEIPGLVLSHANVDELLADVPVAIQTIISHMVNREILVSPLGDIRELLEDHGVVAPKVTVPRSRDYVAHCE